MDKRKKTWKPLRGMDMELRHNAAAGPYFTEAMMEQLKEWGVNCLRVHISCAKGEDVLWKPEGFDTPCARSGGSGDSERYRQSMEELRRLLDFSNAYDIQVIPALGGIAQRIGKLPMYNEPAGDGWYRQVVEFWREIAGAFGGYPNLLAYDLLNEPHGENENEWFFKKCVPETVRAIREIDGETYIMIPAVNWDLPRDFKEMKPVEGDKIVYTVHCYDPHAYTHQGLYNNPDGVVYPGMSKWFSNDEPVEFWDKEALRRCLEPVRAFQLEHDADIFVGEFGVVRWAQGGARWLEDYISLFEEYGWGWAFHSWAEWHGWSPTFPSDKSCDRSRGYGNAITDRLEVLLRYLKRNNKGELR